MPHQLTPLLGELLFKADEHAASQAIMRLDLNKTYSWIDSPNPTRALLLYLDIAICTNEERSLFNPLQNKHNLEAHIIERALNGFGIPHSTSLLQHGFKAIISEGVIEVVPIDGSLYKAEIGDSIEYPECYKRSLADSKIADFNSSYNLDLLKEMKGVLFVIRLHDQDLYDVSRVYESFYSDIFKTISLFLRNIIKVDADIISDDTQRPLGILTIHRRQVENTLKDSSSFNLEVTVERGPNTSQWHVVHYHGVSREDAAKMLADRLGVIAPNFDMKSCNSEVSLAFPMSSTGTGFEGRLLNIFPHASPTHLPLHIRASFAFSILDSTTSSSIGSLEESLLEWNKVIAHEIVPKAWSNLLGSLSLSLIIPADIYIAWPEPTKGLWSTLSARILRLVSEAKSPVFPVLFSSTPTCDGIARYASLEDLLVAEADNACLSSFAAAGVLISLPPPNLSAVMLKSRRCKLLSLEHLRHRLLNCLDMLSSLSSEIRLHILSYLLSTGNILLTTNLPIVPICNGKFVSLLPRTGNTPYHVLLQDDEQDLFIAHDDSAILLSSLPPDTRTIFLSSTHLVNVTSVSLHLHPYLHKAVMSGNLAWNRHEPSEPPCWLYLFWTWVASRKIKLSGKSTQLRLFPDISGRLRKTPPLVFEKIDLDADLYQILEKLNIVFLNPDFPRIAVSQLHAEGRIHSPLNGSALIKALDVNVKLDPSEASQFRIHLQKHLQDSPVKVEFDRINLTGLPIYPIFSAADNAHWFDISWGSIGRTSERVICLDTSHISSFGVGGKWLLPLTTDITFIASPFEGVSVDWVLPFIPHSRALAGEDVLTLYIQRFEDQSRDWQVAFIDRLIKNPGIMSPALVLQLKDKPCLTVGLDRSLRPATAVLDPSSQIAQLFDLDAEYLPNHSDASNHRFIEYFRSHNLLCTELRPSIVTSVLEYLDAHRTADNIKGRATLFLALLERASVCCYEALLDSALCWMPTPHGLVKSGTCRDDLSKYPPELFDHILIPLDFGIHIKSPDLRQALGWSDSLSIDTIIRQFGEEIQVPPSPQKSRRLEVIVTELGERHAELDQQKIDTLRSMTSSIAWIPISPTLLSTTANATLDPKAMKISGLYCIPHHLRSKTGILKFLISMGCSERVSNHTLLEKLNSHALVKLSPDELQEIVHILEMFDFTDGSEICSSLAAPNSSQSLSPIRDLCHIAVDLPNIQMTGSRYEAVHSSLPNSLVSRLGIPSVTSLWIRENDLHPEDVRTIDMESLRQILETLSLEQALHEILGTLAQTGITTFDIVFDERGDVASSSLATPWFKPSPNLIIQTEKILDQEQIEELFTSLTVSCSRGEASQSDVMIGYTSMFRFSEIAMIVSGDSVILLDPGYNCFTCRIHSDKNVFRLSLALHEQIHGCLHGLHGIYGFSEETKYYHGTLFLLPIWERSAHGRPCINDGSTTSHTKALIQRIVSVIPQALLFTSITSTSAVHRTAFGEADLWRASRTCSNIDHEGEVLHSELVQIELADLCGTLQRQSWCVVKEKLERDTLPPENAGFIPMLPGSKDQFLSLAAPVNGPEEICMNGFYFVQAPIPQKTDLPVYISGPFKLTKNRNSILLGSLEVDNWSLQQSFNAWLLGTKTPVLYMYLLETFPTHHPNHYLWPSCHIDSPDPEPAGNQLITRSFYTSLFESSRELCDTIGSNGRICPAEAVFYNASESTNIISVVVNKFSPPELIILPDHIWHHLPQDHIYTFDAHFLRKVLLRASLEALKALTVHDCMEIISYLLECSVDLLDGLCVVPLQNGTLGALHCDGHDKLFIPQDHASLLRSLFPNARVLDADFPLSRRLVEQAWNIVPLTADYISDLIQNMIPQEGVCNLGLQQQDWVSTFWPHFATLQIHQSTVSSFPLLTTRVSGVYISIDMLQSPGIFVSDVALIHSYSWLLPIMEELGGHFLDIPYTQQRLLSGVDFSSLSLTLPRLLRFLGSLPPSKVANTSFSHRVSLSTFIIDSIELSIALSPKYHRLSKSASGKKKGKKTSTKSSSSPIQSSSRAKPNIMRGSSVAEVRISNQSPIATKNSTQAMKVSSSHEIDECKSIAQLIPLWDVHIWTGEQAVVALHEAHMLPATIEFSRIKIFLSSTTSGMFLNYDPKLQKVLDIQVIDSHNLIAQFDFPEIATLDDSEWIADFKQLLDITITTSSLPSRLFIPNTCGIMVKPSALYSRSNALFACALQYRPQYFLHHEFQDWERSLGSFGLRQVVNDAEFKLCVCVADQDVRDSKEQGAIALYKWYNEKISSGAISGFSWDALEDCRFIPRLETRCSYESYAGFSPTQYALQLGSVVSPNQVLLPEYKSVAWTQRALCSLTPSANFLAAHPTFGIPTDAEVIEHLRTLVIIADDHPCNNNVLSDLTDTYKYLTFHPSCHELLLDLQQENLFLNVNNPESASLWRFASVSQLLFDGHDEDYYQAVSDYLHQFEDLLRNIGVKTLIRLDQCQKERCKLGERKDGPMDRINAAYQEQRKDRLFTDVIFISSEGLTSHANRSFLVAAADHFKHHFTGGFSEGRGGENPSEIRLDDVPQQAIECVLAASQEVLKEVLKLLHLWGLEKTAMFTSVQHQLIPTMSIGSYNELISLSDLLNARCLHSAGKDFMEKNAGLIQTLTF
ncbi:hypothetical protein C8Q75DRAFT_894303 [Abortiporus biennis]|nr:hypothetical protein C8Q75DRAFT_894303 [Abortiporus biennis]